MGSNKALLPFGHGLTFAGHLVNCFGIYGCNPVVLVVNDQPGTDHLKQANLITVVNHRVDLGRTYSIRLGLNQVPPGFACVIHNVDNPYLEPDILDRLLEMLQPDTFVVPVHEGRGGHPVLLGSHVADHIRSQDHPADFREMLGLFQRVELPCRDEGILWNINTPGEYQRFIRGFR